MVPQGAKKYIHYYHTWYYSNIMIPRAALVIISLKTRGRGGGCTIDESTTSTSPLQLSSFVSPAVAVPVTVSLCALKTPEGFCLFSLFLLCLFFLFAGFLCKLFIVHMQVEARDDDIYSGVLALLAVLTNHQRRTFLLPEDKSRSLHGNCRLCRAYEYNVPVRVCSLGGCYCCTRGRRFRRFGRSVKITRGDVVRFFGDFANG